MVVKSSSSQLLVRWLRARPPRRSVEATPSFPVVLHPLQVCQSLPQLATRDRQPLDRSTSDVGPSHQSVMSDVIAFGRQLTLDALGTNLRSLPSPTSRLACQVYPRWSWQAHCHRRSLVRWLHCHHGLPSGWDQLPEDLFKLYRLFVRLQTTITCLPTSRNELRVLNAHPHSPPPSPCMRKGLKSRQSPNILSHGGLPTSSTAKYTPLSTMPASPLLASSHGILGCLPA